MAAGRCSPCVRMPGVTGIVKAAWEGGEEAPFPPWSCTSAHPVRLSFPCAATGEAGQEITVLVTGDRSFDIARPQITK